MLGYLDHAATTPLRPQAVEAMLPWLTDRFGNPSGGHRVAQAARKAIDDARDVVADCLGCQPREVVFTGGGTEGDNLAVFGAGGASPVCGATEHHAVLHAVERVGGRTVPVHADGRLRVEDIPGDATFVSVMLVNNEVGTINELPEVDAVLHTDAVQSVTWLDVAAASARADLVSVTGHKLGGPQGTGAIVVRNGIALEPLLVGGGQEQERRSGTHNVAGIVGFAAALRACTDQRDEMVERVGKLRDRLADGLLASIPGVTESGTRDTKVAGICSLLIEDVESEALLFLLDDAGICATAASSCASGALEPSHVLAAMGVPRELARGSLRLSLGWSSTDADVDLALDVIPRAVAQLR
ncbi:MAG TPA: cysteine desulfurase family protein [Acidimicrobiales bacterium]|nr:cysteine desulfurase family protein [Acidimicrobiales bacterium]